MQGLKEPRASAQGQRMCMCIDLREMPRRWGQVGGAIAWQGAQARDDSGDAACLASAAWQVF